jgi:uncharacterized protein with FMN-binding domain
VITMRRIVFWFLSTVSVLVLLFGYNTSTAGSQAVSPSTSVISGGSADRSTANGSNTTSTKNGSGSTNAAKTRTVQGDVVSTRWGPVQVELSLRGNTIAKVNVVQYPNTNSTDIQISNYALPQLIQQTLDAQSAQIDMVSGATYTSGGYVQSLQSALDQANL